MTPTQSTMTKCVLASASGVTALQLVAVDDAHAAALHLLEEDPALAPTRMNITISMRLDVGAGGDHVHRDGDARLVAVAEVLDQVLAASRPVVL